MALRCDQLVEVDTVSIFVRKLNPQITESELRARFSAHGWILIVIWSKGTESGVV